MKNPLTKIEETLKFFGFTIKSKDFNRPWGGFLVFDDAQEFSNKFFEGLDVNTLKLEEN